MTSTFTETSPVDMQKEREWASALGMLDWDKTNIVFTKRTLLEFLKYTGTTVDTNFNNISKLPRYCKFGVLSSPGETSVVSSETTDAASVTPGVVNESGNSFKPTRRVREAPGGKHTDIFGGNDVEDALSSAPPPASGAQTVTPSVSTPDPVAKDEEQYGLDMPSSRSSSQQNVPQQKTSDSGGLTNFWDAKPDEFKPTRRVRQTPGGGGNIQIGQF